MDRLLGKVAIITGAGHGIGKGIARRFASEGAKTVIAEINPETGARTADEIRRDFQVESRFLRTDAGNKESLRTMVDQAMAAFGRVDILVNNAWHGSTVARLEHKTDETMLRGLHVGLLAAFWGMQAVFPHMRAQGGGRIITMCSINGVNAHMYTAEYNVTKEGARALTRTAAREWARHNILANIICPFAATPAYETARIRSPENVAEMLKQNPIGRAGDPEQDIGGVALFLASDDSRYVTGNTIFADGGIHMNGVYWAPVLPD